MNTRSFLAVVSAAACTGAAWPANYNLYWGDIHSHSSYSDDAYQSGNLTPPGGALDYARTNSLLDFAAITDHAEMFTRPEWVLTKQMVDDRNVPGEFVTLLGFEYTNSNPTNEPGYGHKCVIFRDSNVPDDPIGYVGLDGASNAAALWQALQGYNCITIPHHPAKGFSSHEADSDLNMSTDWNYVNASRMPVCEIFSVHGNSEVAGCEEPVFSFREEKSVDAALLRWRSTRDPGYKLGIVGSTDNHMSHPGGVAQLTNNVLEWEGPYTGALLGVWATNKTREAIFDAIVAKRTYAVTSARIRMEFSATYAGQAVPMGATVTFQSGAIPLTITVSAKGDTAPIGRIQIIKNGALFQEQLYTTTVDQIVSLVVTDAQVSAWSYYRAKVFQTETLRAVGDYNTNTPVQLLPGYERAWSSPLWVEGGEPMVNDYDGDAISDLAVYDTANGYWYAYSLQSGRSTIWQKQWGWPGAETVPGDYDGDAFSDLAVYDQANGNWYIWSEARQVAILWARAWGWPGAETVPGDYDGDETSDLAVYDQPSGYWYIITPSDVVLAWMRPWGWTGAITVPGDYDGDAKSDLCVYDSLLGYWYAQSLAGNNLAWAQPWGWPGATTVPGDYDGDGKDDLAVYDQPSGSWYIASLSEISNLKSQMNAPRVLAWGVPWGWTGAVPVPGDYDGDGIADLAVFDTLQGYWYIWSFAKNAVIAWAQPWGWPGAYPPGGRE